MNNANNAPSTVLFVDDEEKARKYFALAMAGEFKVLTAGSVAEAADLLARHGNEVSVILSDQRMPEQTGVDLLKNVREYYPHIIRLLTTAYTEIEDAIEAINRGEILRYIQKPWDIGTLKSELRHAQDYFLLKWDRDNLLQEKLSVRQRMVHIERIGRLLVVAEAFPYLRFPGFAFRKFIDWLVSNRRVFTNPGFDRDPRSMDFADLEITELNRMQGFIHSVTSIIYQHREEFENFTASLDESGCRQKLEEIVRTGFPDLEMEISPPDRTYGLTIGINEPLFHLLLENLLSLLHHLGEGSDTLAVTIKARSESQVSKPGLQINFSLSHIDFSPVSELLAGSATKAIPECCTNLLMVFLLCSHHGGSTGITFTEKSGGLVLNLPASPEDAVLKDDPGSWHERILQSFELEID